MIRNIQRPWFEVWGSEEAQNRVLKGLLALAFALNCVQTLALVIITSRGPTLITVSPYETKSIANAALSDELIELETKRALRSYIQTRHTWSWQNVDGSFAKASKFIEASQVKAFRAVTGSQAKLAKEKKLSQKFYEDSLSVDLKSKTAEIRGEKVLIVEGLRATTPQAFRLTFEHGPRTMDNAEGIYILADPLIVSADEQIQEAK